MPFQIGSVAVHDDGQHFGSSKRDAADGVAGLDSGGDILVVGNTLSITRDGADNFYIRDRTSGDWASMYLRAGAHHFYEYLQEAGVPKRVQTEGMKDAVNGIAALGAGGQLLAPGPDIELTRDGSENIEVVERTSGDIVFRWTRIGVNNFECRINCGGVACKMLNDSLINVVNGIAGLDANVLLSPALLPPCLEDYSNHLGAVDNFTEVNTAANGTAVEDAANHELDLSSGITNAGYGNFITKKTYTLDTKPLIYNCLIQNYAAGAGAQRRIRLGLSTLFTIATEPDAAKFGHVDGTWYASTAVGDSWTNTAISALSNGDLVTIIATSARVLFFVNGVEVAEHSTNIPTAALYVGASAAGMVDGVTTSTAVSIDMFNVRKLL